MARAQAFDQTADKCVLNRLSMTLVFALTARYGKQVRLFDRV